MRKTRNRLLQSAAIILVAGAVVGWWRSTNRTPTVTIPSAVARKANAYRCFEMAGGMVRDANVVDKALHGWSTTGLTYLKPPPVRVWSRFERERILQRNAAALAALDRCLQHDLSSLPPVWWDCKPIGNLWALGLLAVMRGQLEAERGDWGSAMRSYLAAMQLGELLLRGGVVGLHAGLGVQYDAREGIERAVEHLAASDLNTAITQMELVNRLHVEFADVLTPLKWILLNERQANLRCDSFLECLSLARGSKEKLAVVMRGKRGITAELARYMDQNIARVRKPYALRSSLPTMPLDPYFHGPFMDVDSEWCNYLANQTWNQQIVVVLAVRRFQLEKGRLPTSLRELVTDYLRDVPNDLFASNAKLKYRRSGGGYLVYSVGPDGIDDKGTPIAPRPLVVGINQNAVEPSSTGDVSILRHAPNGDASMPRGRTRPQSSYFAGVCPEERLRRDEPMTSTRHHNIHIEGSALYWTRRYLCRSWRIYMLTQ